MTPREIVQSQIRHEETAEVPFTLTFEPDVGTRLDEYYGSSKWRDRLGRYIRRTAQVATIKPDQFDDTHYRDAFGTVWRNDKLPPAVVEPGLKTPSFEGYPFPTATAVLDPEGLSQARATAKDDSDAFTIIMSGICLWRCWYIRGFEATMMDIIAEEDFYTELLDRMTDLTIEVIESCADIPADAIMSGDDWGDQRGILIGPERWRKFYKPRYERIFDAIHRQGKFAIMHCCGSVADIMGDIIDCGLDVLESIQPEASGMNPYELKRKWGDKITFWGGLGSQSTIPFGSADEVRGEIRRLRREMSSGGGYILAPAKPLRPETPTENAVAVVDTFLEQEAM